MKEYAELLKEFLSLDTEPVGVKLFKDRSEWKGSLIKTKTNLCQMVSMSRYQGSTCAQVAEGMICVLGACCLGLIKTPTRFINGEAVVGKYTIDAEVGKKFIENTYMLGNQGKLYDLVLTAPLKTIDDPDIVVIYTNPAQILPLVHAYIYDTGNKIAADTVAEAALCASLAFAHGEDAPIIGFPCAGDRRFAGTQHHELLFALPSKQLPHLIENLKIKRQANPRLYPVAPSMQWVPMMPPAYTLSDDDLVD
ncbi:MAG TPA: DUF169 domain-containing protein [Caldisericia bacterium]|jgi:uncharacterized protein (DUF169 family)|nr:DUF169 domain-containing protein [Caldisericia bacterium]